MVSLFINNKKYNFKQNLTVLQACTKVGIDIPRFCFHDKLSIAGNCRMCLVEVKGSLKPVASCAMPVAENMDIFTNTIFVKKARESVLEFLLINHPLDCPICDQGGECDLQDQVMVYGSDRGRFYEAKRAVSNKNFGPIVKTLMTRCIHCTRCVRFISEIAGLSSLGMTGRGSKSEISTYIQQFLKTELSGNVIDVCPVGALTSKPLAFKSRSWELRSIDSIDVFDGICSNIRIESRGNDIMRIMPRPNDLVNEDWISDKVRYSFDGLNLQRLSYPLYREKCSEDFINLSWSEVLLKLTDKFKVINKDKVLCLSGEINDLETLVAYKDFGNKVLETSNFFIQKDINNINSDFRENFSFNNTYYKVDQADLVILVGLNPRIESPVFNIRLRRLYSQKKKFIFSLGFGINLSYYSSLSGLNMNNIINLFEGRSLLSNLVSKSKQPLIIFGESFIRRLDSNSLELFRFIMNNLMNSRKFNFTKNWNIINLFYNYTGLLNARELGITSSYNKFINNRNLDNLELVYALNVRNFDSRLIGEKTFSIFQGHHGDKSVSNFNVILPGSSNFEKNGIYMNSENKFFKSRYIINPPFESREDWKIFTALNLKSGALTDYDNLKQLRVYLEQFTPISVSINNESKQYKYYNVKNNIEGFNKTYIIFNTIIEEGYTNFYKSDFISQSSLIMSQCNKELLKGNLNFSY